MSKKVIVTTFGILFLLILSAQMMTIHKTPSIADTIKQRINE